MRIMRAGMESENQKMRRIISVYIQSSELNDPAWEVMEEDDMGGTLR
jgi:nitrogen fixation protein